MKYMHRNVVVMLTIFLCITACSRGERIKEISDVEPGDFKKYAGTYVGNNSDVVAIVNHLSGGDTFQSISLENESIKVYYGAKGNGTLTEDMVETYWFNGKDTMEKNFLFNVIYLAILVPNAKSYEFQVENKNFTIKREEILSILYEKFDNFPKENDIWDKKKVVKFLNENNEEITMLMNDKEFRNALFVKYPVQQLK
ncbi:DUF4825 domain-containing protein [Bacillus paranthracis]|uniref:DUF4825 domain-containing protein n=4 Tax=Bacillus cereus group TaxID=86661 RepID=A0A5M9H3P2_9BACI|nr:MULTISPECIES: DUF4825 domain-containing protein [Bacillus]ACJ80018.1 group-specific protein [Bacillus cereus AH187]ACM13169.1 conserved hypothetical protein [Bacillus cereus Q1]EDZ59455.1 conserved hypothetical protein [Bacillus cereus H3081.97]EEL00350.1 hypothetical protein bcere0013_26520 [Bacillus cereus BDRD-ST26]EJP99887.1 hypothetical protein IAU_00724 [Bacillus cereus IS075]EJQ07235.1 hypothetical protein IC5_01844 [Bacillus cereus AND1407]EJR17197.1 hypothetical protein II7_01381